jgi:hypothetical protein
MNLTEISFLFVVINQYRAKLNAPQAQNTIQTSIYSQHSGSCALFYPKIIANYDAVIAKNPIFMCYQNRGIHPNQSSASQ